MAVLFTNECIMLELGEAESTKSVLQQLAEDVRELNQRENERRKKQEGSK